jgi:hypothetical protein
VAASRQELDHEHDDIQQPRRYTAPWQQVHRNYETVPVSWVNVRPKTQSNLCGGSTQNPKQASWVVWVSDRIDPERPTCILQQRPYPCATFLVLLTSRFLLSFSSAAVFSYSVLNTTTIYSSSTPVQKFPVHIMSSFVLMAISTNPPSL